MRFFFLQIGADNILLGSTSRGTGSLENCGGIDNPTHYVRYSKLFFFIIDKTLVLKHLQTLNT